MEVRPAVLALCEVAGSVWPGLAGPGHRVACGKAALVSWSLNQPEMGGDQISFKDRNYSLLI